MNAELLHTELVGHCGEIVKHYRDDLLVHDLAAIQVNGSETPFLHFSRECGTYMVFLIAADKYPEKGSVVPFLFGHANREHILTQAVGLVDALVNKTGHVCHYWDGKRLRKIELHKALAIATEYERLIRQQWAKDYMQQPVLAYHGIAM